MGGDRLFCPEELIILTQMIALTIVQGKTVDELNVLSSIYSQIGSTLAMYSVQKSSIEDACNPGAPSEFRAVP